ncbi:MAG TPA: response regulator [Verrucomicrobia bacterium]|nr:MAG: hypothetical protein A2X46_00090 [Lentisphaerae bacterium GWF2_57_35]HBA84387.1 response regulator [Verrucomicrobiota bacterium]
MKTLIVEDSFTQRVNLQAMLSEYGDVHIAVNGKEAMQAFHQSIFRDDAPYDLICLDIIMPEMDGQSVLKEIRSMEDRQGIPPGDGAKIVMTTTFHDKDNIMKAFRTQADAYLVKPIDRALLISHLKEFGLIPSE